MIPRIVSALALCSFLLPAQVPDFRPPTPLFGAVLRNDTQAIKQLLASGADPNEARFFGFPAIVLSLVHSNEEAVRAMLEHGADPKITDGRGSTTLMWAAGGELPSPALADEFLKRGVDPNAANKFGETALTWAMRRGDIAMVERLKNGGATDARLVRESVERAVALLQKSGPEFTKVSGCVSCHHQSVPQMAYAAARSRGYHVDPAVSDAQVKAVMAMMKPMKEGLETGKAKLPSPGISVSYTLLGLAAEGYVPDEYTAAMAKAVAREQLPDGSFPIMPARPPMESSSITAAALSIRALQKFGSNSGEHVERAAEWLRRTRPTNSEERAMKLLGLAWAGVDRKDLDAAAADMLAQQRPDGGWAQLNALETDAYATGQAILTLREANAVNVSDPAFQRGIAYLLRTQLPDGSWHVRTRSNPVQQLKDSGFPHGRDQWISAAGTSWAVMALAASQPKADAQSSGGMF